MGSVIVTNHHVLGKTKRLVSGKKQNKYEIGGSRVGSGGSYAFDSAQSWNSRENSSSKRSRLPFLPENALTALTAAPTSRGMSRASSSWTVEGDEDQTTRRYVENDWENSLSGSGTGERATGTVKALTESAPTARKVRTALGNMMVRNVVRKNR